MLNPFCRIRSHYLDATPEDCKPSEQSKPQSLTQRLDLVTTDTAINTAAIAVINANSQAQLSHFALGFSGGIIVLLILLHSYFSYIERPLIFPPFVEEIVWCFVVAPWMGAGMSKLVTMFAGKIEDRK